MDTKRILNRSLNAAALGELIGEAAALAAAPAEEITTEEIVQAVVEQNRVSFTREQIITAISALLKHLADPHHQLLERSDVRPHVVEGTGIWVDPNMQGDEHGSAEDYIGFGFVIPDAEDADTKEPFVTAVKVHIPSFEANPKRYSLALVGNMARGIGKMQAEMEFTGSKEGKRIRREARLRERRLRRIAGLEADQILH